MFLRSLKPALQRYAKFPVVALLGPRQSGKTTLAKATFPQHAFVSFDRDIDRNFANDEPERFLEHYSNEHGIILDEFQYVPRLVSYIKLEVDKKKRPGYFVLTGSENFLMNQEITESLAGRVGILTLLPLSLAELTENNILPATLDEVLLKGGYPRIYDEDFDPIDFYPSYIQSYIERDVRQLVKVGSLRQFQHFIQMCAGRIGNLVNIQQLCNDVGIVFDTARRWLSLLEASYIIFFLEPHFQNFTKRLVKTPKLYFYDTGLACSLLRITSTQTLAFSPFRGPLFESLILSDLAKQYYNQGMRPPLYFWRDRRGTHEVDGIIDQENMLFPIEIKASSNMSHQFFKGLTYWNELAQANPENGFLVYGGKDTQQRAKGTIVGWKSAGDIQQMVSKKIAAHYKTLTIDKSNAI